MKCRLCGKPTVQFLNLGKTPLPEDLPTKQELTRHPVTYPLGLSYCRTCFHVQLTTKVPPDEIYKKHYLYDYSVTHTGLVHWKNLAVSLMKQYGLTKNSFVVDVGSNTGTFLKECKQLGLAVLGVDPSPKLADIAVQQGIPTIKDYFTLRVAKGIRKARGPADCITVTNVFDHVDDLDACTEAIRTLLAPKGICIIEIPYFLLMLNHQTHIVYHHQIDYMCVTPLLPFFRRHNLEVADAQVVPLHGGSLRLTVTHTGIRNISAHVQSITKSEQYYYKRAPQHLITFSKKVLTQRDRLKKTLQQYKRQGKTIAGIGASAKGLTFLAYCGIGRDTVDFITDKSGLKTGRFTPGGIPIVTDDALFTKQPDIALFLAWNFTDEIKKRLAAYRGRLVNPLTGRIISGHP